MAGPGQSDDVVRRAAELVSDVSGYLADAHVSIRAELAVGCLIRRGWAMPGPRSVQAPGWREGQRRVYQLVPRDALWSGAKYS